MEFCALASGSSGNCFYVQSGGTSVLIDAGISAKQITQRLSAIGKSPENINGIFVTHEHVDHIRGIDVFARQNNIPVYLTKDTMESASICRDDELLNVIKNDESVKLGEIKISAFPKQHDASDPVSYMIEGDKKICIATDIGVACENVALHISNCDAIILESNHDVEMLKNGRYPAYLKKRILSEKGHLSNYDAALLVLQHATKKLKHVLLSHISQNNNTPEVALRTFEIVKERKDLRPKISVSVRESPSDYITLK